MIFVSETLCLEFCNTGASFRLKSGSDGVPDESSLASWLQVQGFSVDLTVSGGEIGKVHAFREILFRFFSGTASIEDKEIVAKEVELAMSRLRLKESDGGFALVPDLQVKSLTEAAIALVALSTARLLTGDALKRLRVCANNECQWLFLDRSKNRSRRWCEMSSCGNKMKARRHYARKREAIPG